MNSSAKGSSSPFLSVDLKSSPSSANWFECVIRYGYTKQACACTCGICFGTVG